MSRRSVRALGGTLTTVVLCLPLLAVAAPSHATSAPAGKSTCKTINRQYPTGVAGSSRAAQRYRHATGISLPVRPRVYRQAAALDKDNDGVICASASVATPSVAQSESGVSARPLADCKLTAGVGRNVSLGFDRPVGRAASTGRLTVTVLFVDFANSPAQTSPQAAYANSVAGAIAQIAELSYGRLALDAVPLFTWLRLPRSSDDYGLARGMSFAAHTTYIQDAISAADPLVDFSRTDEVVIIAPPTATGMGFSPAFTALPGRGLMADGRTLVNGVTLGTDALWFQDRVLTHELLHTLGLVDLYSLADVADLSKVWDLTGPYSIMNRLGAKSLGPFGWERWVLSWIDDTQVRCLARGASDLTLEPVSRVGSGIKMAVVLLGGGRALAVESRSSEGLDKSGNAGVVAYIVRPTAQSGYGPIVVPRGNDGSAMSPLSVGQEMTFEGVSVTVETVTAEGYGVRITVP